MIQNIFDSIYSEKAEWKQRTLLKRFISFQIDEGAEKSRTKVQLSLTDREKLFI